jgi:catechol 2,3-dioxygenase-like lactoylglutathione lyase family enzyme
VKRARLENIAPVLLSADVAKTAEYYHGVLGFEVVEHYGASEPFAALYRDGVEIIFVQAPFGQVEPNALRFGAGYDLYLDPEDVEGVDLLHAEFASRGACILREPRLTPYGCYEFVVEDVDGRRVGVGRVKDRAVFFNRGPRSGSALREPPAGHSRPDAVTVLGQRSQAAGPACEPPARPFGDGGW